MDKLKLDLSGEGRHRQSHEISRPDRNFLEKAAKAKKLPPSIKTIYPPSYPLNPPYIWKKKVDDIGFGPEMLQTGFVIPSPICWNIKGEAIEQALTMIIDYTCYNVRK